MDSWERFTAGSGVSKVNSGVGGVCVYRFARLHPPSALSTKKADIVELGHGGS